MPTLAQKLPYTHPFAGGFPYRGSQRLPSDPDALTYLAAVAAADGAPVETAVAVAVDDFFRGIKADNTFSAIKAACLLCGARTLAGALVPLVGTAPTNVADGFVAGDYTRGGATPGLQGDGTSYLDSGRAPSDGELNDAHLACYVSAAATSNTHYKAGAYSIATQQTILRSNFGTFIASVNSGNFAASGGGNAVGLFGASRFAADSSEFRVAGETTPDSTASDASSTQNITIFARNDGTPDGFFDGTIAFYSIGEALDLEALDARVTALVTAIGAAV